MNDEWIKGWMDEWMKYSKLGGLITMRLDCHHLSFFFFNS